MLNKKYLFIILLTACALVVGFINVFPNIIEKNLLAKEGKEYYPYTWGTDDLYILEPRIKTVADGQLIVSDVNIYEYKNYPPFWPALPPLLYYPILKIADGLTNTILISHFLFPALIFFLFFGLAYAITKKKYLSLFFACFFALYHQASIHFPPFAIEHLKAFVKILLPFDIGNNSSASYLVIKESFIPSFPILLLAIIFFYLNYKENKKIYIILAGIFYALNAYTYPFHFIWLSTALLILFIILCWQKRFDVVKRFIFSFLIALVFLLPFFYWQIKLRMLPQYSDIFQRHGVERGRLFRFSYWREYIWYLFLAGFVYLWGKRTDRKTIAFFIISFILAGIFVLNMQLVLGFNMQPRHWEIRDIFLGLSLGWLVAFWWLSDYGKKINKNSLVVLLGIIIIASLISHNLIVFYKLATKNYDKKTIPEYIQKSHNWLNNNTAVDSVVASPAFSTFTFIPAYTHNNIFIPMGCNSFAPEEEIFERLIITYKLFGVKRDQLMRLLEQNKRNVDLGYPKSAMYAVEDAGLGYLVCVKYFNTDFDMDTRYGKPQLAWRIPAELYEKVLKMYDTIDLAKALKKYRLDYLYLGPIEKEMGSPDFSQYQKVYDNQGVAIYKFNKP